jgi:hypothetical protein
LYLNLKDYLVKYQIILQLIHQMPELDLTQLNTLSIFLDDASDDVLPYLIIIYNNFSIRLNLHLTI